jgi:hypothetical protein
MQGVFFETPTGGPYAGSVSQTGAPLPYDLQRPQPKSMRSYAMPNPSRLHLQEKEVLLKPARAGPWPCRESWSRKFRDGRWGRYGRKGAKVHGSTSRITSFAHFVDSHILGAPVIWVNFSWRLELQKPYQVGSRRPLIWARRL